VNLLLDTHIALWALTDDPRLSEEARELISVAGIRVFASVASMWEVASKRAIKPEKMPLSGVEFLHYCEQAGYASLPVRGKHVIALESLPDIHGDPFDRILIAQARAEALLFLTHDTMLGRYGEPVRLV
jgi:PIN domain nuclease of toxin-antitoxin system